MLLGDESSCQAHCLDGLRSASVAGSARGGNLDVAAADKRSATNRSQETNLQLDRPIDFCVSLSASPRRSRCAGDCQAGDRSQMASRWLPVILALEIETAWWQANSSVGDTQGYPRDEHCQSAVGERLGSMESNPFQPGAACPHSDWPNKCAACVIAPPARMAAATTAVSASCASVAPAFRASLV
jgi:hypothetical protein